MAGSLNKVQIIGSLGRDPESRSFQNGGKVVNLRVATSESWKDKSSGERKEKTEWHSVAIFSDGLCNVAERYLRKGSKVFIEGQLQTRKWQDQSGADRYSTEIVLQGYNAQLILLDSNGGGQQRSSGASETVRDVHGLGPLEADLDDDVPFITNSLAYEPGISRRRVI